MADFTKAGSDRNDFEKQLKHLLISANWNYLTYSDEIDNLTVDELKADLEEYLIQIETEIAPVIKKAEESGEEKLIEKAYKVKSVYDEIIGMIKKQIDEISS